MYTFVFFLIILGKFQAPTLGKEERSSTDKKRERRKKKHLQHKKRIFKESNAKEMEKRGIKPNHNKDSALKELKRLISSGHQVKEVRLIHILIIVFIFMYFSCINAIFLFQLKSIDDKSMKTSTDFFSRLQDQAKNEINGKKRIMKENGKNNSKKFKK